MNNSMVKSRAVSDVVMDKRSHRDWISALPDEILVTILQELDAKSAVSTSILSRRWRHLWTFLQSLHFSEFSLPDNYCWVRLGPMQKEYLNENKINHFIPSLRWLAGIKRGNNNETALRRLSLVFSGSDECADAVNGAIASAAEQGVKEIEVAVVGGSKYEFPSWLFAGDTCSSLASLCLNHCMLSVSLSFRGFSALTKLVLVGMHMSPREAQVLLRNCKSLKSLYLIEMFDIRFIQLPKLEELVWIWSCPLGPFKIDTPALQRLEYCGDLLPTSTFQSLPCLQHVSLQYLCLYGNHPDCHGEKLRTISTRFSHAKSLHLRFVVWDDSNFQHSSLKQAEMYNFKGRDNEIGFARLILRRAPNLRCIAFSQVRLYENEDHQCIPSDWPAAQEFSARDNQLVLSKLMDDISSSAHVSFMY